MNKLEQLEKAYKKERSSIASTRMLAVLIVCKDGKQVQETANILRHCPNWVRMWVDRLDGLRDRP